MSDLIKGWVFDDAVELARNIELALSPRYHAALTGSCLFRGSSTKDVDIIVYPHSTSARMLPEDVLKLLEEKLEIRGAKRRDHTEYGDDKLVFSTWLNNRRVDIFFLS